MNWPLLIGLRGAHTGPVTVTNAAERFELLVELKPGPGTKVAVDPFMTFPLGTIVRDGKAFTGSWELVEGHEVINGEATV
jgi:hypothetical protein